MSPSTPPLQARLHYLMLSSPEPERLARFYSQVFDTPLRSEGVHWICEDTERHLVFCEGASNTLVAAGYAAADVTVLDGLVARLSTHQVSPAGADGYFFEQTAVAFRDPDGNRMVYGLPAERGRQAVPRTPHARLQHVVVGSTDVSRMTAFYTTTVGLKTSDEVHDEGGMTRAAFLRTDEEHHSFAVFRTSRTRLDHHCYELPDWNSIRDWADRLAEHGIPLKWGPGRHGPGNNLFLFFHDPDGNWVELSAELQRVPIGKAAGRWPHEERTLNKWGNAHLRS
jgi:catechol 2,3-dioxygenase